MANRPPIAGSRPRKVSRPWSGAGLAILLAGVIGAGGRLPKITKIEIAPSRVVVGSDASSPTSFELEARLWTGDADRVSIVGGYVLQWTVSQPWLRLVSKDGFRAKFEVAAGALPAGATSGTTGYIQVTADNITTTPGAEIVLVPNQVTADDAVEGKYDSDRPPGVVLVSGNRVSADAPCVSMSAFVRRATVGPLVAKCDHPEMPWGVAVLSRDHGMVLTPPVGWTSGPDPVVDAASMQQPRRKLPVALHIMALQDAEEPVDPKVLNDSLVNIALDDLKAADSLLRENRAGIELDAVKTEVIQVSNEVTVTGCPSGDTATAAHDVPGVLNVYYVNEMIHVRGETCDRHSGRLQDAIYVIWPRNQSTTLVHEIGHALGLLLPGQGHTDTLRGLDRTNIMSSGDQDTDPGGRRRFTVGQVFRMNADSASWLTWAPDGSGIPNQQVLASTAVRLRCQCGMAALGRDCPGLGEDVVPMSDRPDGTYPWDCDDQVIFYEVSDSEKPVAVVAGRRWGTAPGSCRTDLPGRTEKHWNATFVEFDNLTRPGSCPAWAAIFFRERGVFFMPLGEPDVVFTANADVIKMADTLPSRIEVPVHLYYSSSDLGQVRRDTAYAAEVFGASNRSGIVLRFKEYPNATCPPSSLAPTDIEVCYVSTGTDEGSLAGRHIDLFGARTENSLAYYLGRALGLSDLAVTAQGPSSNLMRHDSADRGSKLTLSQVFLISAGLNPNLCGSNSTACPDLSEDVNP